MGNYTSNNVRVTQDFYNNIAQVNQQTCVIASTTEASGNIIGVNGSIIDGNFTGVQQATNTDATCLITSSMDSSVTNILQSIANQSNAATTDLFGDFTFNREKNRYDAKQTVVNNISQINQATCDINTTTSANNDYIYVANTRIGGNFIGVLQNTTSKSSCNLNNNMKISVYNKAQSKATQSNTVIGMFVAIAIAIVCIIGLIVVGLIVFFAVGGMSYIGFDKKPKGEKDENSEEVELKDLELEQAEE